MIACGLDQCRYLSEPPYQYPSPTLNGDGAIEPMQQRLLQLQDELHRCHGGLQASWHPQRKYLGLHYVFEMKLGSEGIYGHADPEAW